MERDSTAFYSRYFVLDFNSHAHVERDHCSLKTVCIPFDFNSHAHVERDNSTPNFDKRSDISTHTLTWSVTSGLFMEQIRIINFNSHAHVERDNSITTKNHTLD